MEQGRSGEVRALVRLGDLGQFASFAAFMAFCFYFFTFAFATPFQNVLYFALAVSVPLFAIALRLDNLKVASVAWFILASPLVITFAAIHPSYSSPVVFVLMTIVLLLVASYEQTRFSFGMDPVIRACRNIESEVEVEAVSKVIRKHTLSLFQNAAISLAVCVVFIFMSESFSIVVNPPIISVSVLVVVAVAAIVLMGSKILGQRENPERKGENAVDEWD